MSTEEAKSTAATAGDTSENNVTTTQKVAYGEEKIRVDDDEEEEMPPREKKPADVTAVANNKPTLVPTSTREDSDEIKIQTYSEPTPPTKKENDKDSLSMKAHHAEESVLDVVDAVGVKVGSFAKKKFGEVDKSLNSGSMSAAQDSRKIEALGPMVEELARVFEDTTTMIRNVPYEEQVDLLMGYKKLIEEQIKVIDSRINMSKRLK
jgi:hypothetical protein